MSVPRPWATARGLPLMCMVLSPGCCWRLMKFQRFGVLPICASLLFLVAARAEASPQSHSSWPKLDSKYSLPECNQVLNAARLLFNSTAPEFSEDCQPVRKAKLGVILGPLPNYRDCESNCAFWFDSTYIEADNPAGERHRIFKQKDAESGSRFVVGQKPMNWQGDWFDLYCVDANMPVNKVEALVNESGDSGQVENKKMAGAYIVYRNLWHRPWLFRNPTNKHVVAVNPRSDWPLKEKVIPDWAIYRASASGQAELIGIIRFSAEAKPLALLPNGPLHEMFALLDNIIGIPSQSEGTLQPTARLRGETRVAVGNLMLRPWALGQPKNSKEEVEKGLQRWSKGSVVYRKQYEQLKLLYPRALDALTVYYQKTFKEPPAKARALAVRSLDLAYRSHFTF